MSASTAGSLVHPSTASPLIALVEHIPLSTAVLSARSMRRTPRPSGPPGRSGGFVHLLWCPQSEHTVRSVTVLGGVFAEVVLPSSFSICRFPLRRPRWFPPRGGAHGCSVLPLPRRCGFLPRARMSAAPLQPGPEAAYHRAKTPCIGWLPCPPCSDSSPTTRRVMWFAAKKKKLLIYNASYFRGFPVR